MLDSKRLHRLAIITLALYILCLIWIITLKCNIIQPVVESRYFFGKMTPWERIVFSTSKFARTDAKDFFVNVLLFVPVGLLIPFAKANKPHISAAFFGIALSLGFEILQIVICVGGFTYIDILSNSFGAIIGSLLHFFLRGRVTEKQTNVALAVCAALTAVIVAFGILNTAIHLDIYVADNLSKYL